MNSAEGAVAVPFAISLAELLADNRSATAKWKDWFEKDPKALEVPCDIYKSETVAGFIRHIFAVELRHSQRLSGQKVTEYAEVASGGLDTLMLVHDRAVANLESFLSEATAEQLAETIEFQTVSAGTIKASRRKLFAHILLHSIRHWAQMTTVLRQHGFATDWAKDFLFSDAIE